MVDCLLSQFCILVLKAMGNLKESRLGKIACSLSGMTSAMHMLAELQGLVDQQWESCNVLILSSMRHSRLIDIFFEFPILQNNQIILWQKKSSDARYNWRTWIFVCITHLASTLPCPTHSTRIHVEWKESRQTPHGPYKKIWLGPVRGLGLGFRVRV